MRRMRAVLRVLGVTTAVVIACLYLGMGISTSVPMPGYAVVFLDDDAKTYLAPSCAGDWERRPSTKIAFLRRATAGEAYRLKYEPDEICRQTGAFFDDDRSLTGLLLMKLGLLGPAQHWWDAPYRTEEGIVYPKPSN